MKLHPLLRVTRNMARKTWQALFRWFQSNRLIVLAILGGSLLIAIVLDFRLGACLRENGYNNDNNINNRRGTTTSAYTSPTATFKYAAVVADSKVGSAAGTEILARNRGNAIDAAVAAVFVTGLSNAHSSGLGGGIFFIIYDSERNEWHAVDSRGTAPGVAAEDMYAGNISNSLHGGMASTVPGELLALWEVHRRFGKLPWREVVAPSIKLCEEGFPLTNALHIAIQKKLFTPKHKQDFAPYFDNNGNIKPLGSLIKLPKLAQTLRVIAENPTSFYNGSLARDLVTDLQEEGGLITLKDLRDYRVIWRKPTMFPLPGGYTLYSSPSPGSGPVLSYILNILTGYNMTSSHIATKEAEILTYHRIVEAFKFAYVKRAEMGDEQFVDMSQILSEITSLSHGEAIRARIDDSRTHPLHYYEPTAANTEDHGTSHLSVIDGQGNVVAATGSINTYFGNGVLGRRTGVLFNNIMNDFSVPNEANVFGLPPSKSNYIRPGKRPMSSKSPAVIWDENRKKVRLVTGASGGSKITTTTAMNIIDVLWLRRPLSSAIDRRRLHHQLIPPFVQLETDFPKDLEEGLKAKGHETGPMRLYSVIQAIDIHDDGKMVATADFRKDGEPMGL